MRHLAAVITSKYLMCHVTETALSSAMAAMVVKATQDMVLVIICVEMQTGSTTCRPVTAKLLIICMSGATIPVRHILHISIPVREKKTRFQEMKKWRWIKRCFAIEYMLTFDNYIKLAKWLNMYNELFVLSFDSSQQSNTGQIHYFVNLHASIYR